MAGELELLPSGSLAAVVGHRSDGVAVREMPSRLLDRYRRSLPLRVAGSGDSIIFGGGTKNTSFQDFINYLYPGTIINAGNFGSSGQNSAYILANDVPRVIAAAPDVATYNGGINDIQAMRDYLLMRADQMAAITAYLDAGISPVMVGLTPHDTYKYAWQSVRNNIWWRLYCAKNKLAFVSAWELWASYVGAYASGMALDSPGIHPNQAAALKFVPALHAAVKGRDIPAPLAYLLLAQTDTNRASCIGSISGTTFTVASAVTGKWMPGQRLAASGILADTIIIDGPTGGGTGTYTINKSQTVSSGTSFVGVDVNNHIINGLSFTDTDADGRADGWAAFGSGGTYSITAEDSGDFGKWQRCTMTGGTNVGFDSQVETFARLGGWAVGDKIAVGYKVRGNGGLSFSQTFSGMSAASLATERQFPITNMTLPDNTVMTYYGEGIINAGATQCGLRFQATGTGWFEISRPTVVNLTQLGLA